jgi:hypothetical protein
MLKGTNLVASIRLKFSHVLETFTVVLTRVLGQDARGRWCLKRLQLLNELVSVPNIGR